MISFDRFKELELKIVNIVRAERVEGSEKLLKLTADLGGETRQIIAGIGRAYEPETLVGKQIVIVANLEPRSLMGLESQGMLLAANGKQGPVLLIPENEVSPGTEIR